MGKRSRERFDNRLITDHPAGRDCIDACTANGWAPQNADVLRLISLWTEVREGKRTEHALSPVRLEFARWLVQRGRINEDLESEKSSEEDCGA